MLIVSHYLRDIPGKKNYSYIFAFLKFMPEVFRSHFPYTLYICISYHFWDIKCQTSVSETIRKPPLVKAQTALKTKKIKYGEKRFSIWRMEFLHPAMWHDHDIDFVRWLHPAMWHVALEFVTANSPSGNVIRGSGMTCHWIRPNVHHIGILHLVSISTHHRSRHVILYQSAKFYPNRTTLSRKNDVMSIFKIAYLSHLKL